MKIFGVFMYLSESHATVNVAVVIPLSAEFDFFIVRLVHTVLQFLCYRVQLLLEQTPL